MPGLVKALTLLLSLAAGLLAARGVYDLLPSWEGEDWSWVALDTGSLLLAFWLICALVYYFLSDLGRWLLAKVKRPPGA